MVSARSRARVETGWEMKAQIIMLAVAAIILLVVGFILLALLGMEKDPVISLLFAILLGGVSVVLGGSIVWAYLKYRVAEDAKDLAQEMTDRALGGGLEDLAKQHKRYYEDLFDKERQQLIGQFEAEKAALKAKIADEAQAKCASEEDSYARELRVEFERRLEDEKNAYITQIDEDFDRQLEEEKKAVTDGLRKEFDGILQAERDALAREFEGKLDGERDAIRVEYERTLAGQEKALEERLRAQVHGQAEEEKKRYLDIVKADFEQWKVEFSEDFRKEVMRDVKPLHEDEEAPKGKPEDISDIFKPAPGEPARPQPIEDKDVKEYDFFPMSSRQKLDAAVDMLSGKGSSGVVVVFVNGKSHRRVSLKMRGGSVAFFSDVEVVSIRSRIRLREYCAGRKLVMDKNDDFIRVLFAGDLATMKSDLGEVMAIAFNEQVDAMNLEVKLEEDVR